MAAIHCVVLGGAPQYGPELVDGGDFSSAAPWTLGTGWSVTGGQAVKGVGGGGISQVNTGGQFVFGASYEVSYTLSNYAGGGGVFLSLTGFTATNGAVRSANGTYTEVLTCPNPDFGSITIAVNPTLGSETLELDNLTIRRKFY